MSSGSDEAYAGLDGVHNRLDSLVTKIENLQDELADERERREELEEELERRESRIHDLEQCIDELDARTDLLDLVRHADDTSAAQRRVALIMHLKRAAEAGDSKASLDQNKAEDVLHHPDIDRTTYYTDMDEAANLVADPDVLSYSDGVLKLDLEAGDLPGEATLRQRAVEGSR